jgi:hypothetical protein
MKLKINILCFLCFFLMPSSVLCQDLEEEDVAIIKDKSEKLIIRLQDYFNSLANNKGVTRTFEDLLKTKNKFFMEGATIAQDFKESPENLGDDKSMIVDDYIRTATNVLDDLSFSYSSPNMMKLCIDKKHGLCTSVTFNRVLSGKYGTTKTNIDGYSKKRIAHLVINKESTNWSVRIRSIENYNPSENYCLQAAIIKRTEPLPQPVRETLTISSPTYNTNVEKGAYLAISWQSNTKGNIKIELLKNGYVKEVITYNTSNNGQYNNWVPPNSLLAGAYQVRLTTESGLSRVSDDFVIKDRYIAPILTKSLLPTLLCIPLPSFSNKKRAGWWLETALVYGLVGGSIYMNNQSQDYYKQYNAALEPEQRNTLFDKANLYNKISITSQWTGLAYWGATIVATYLNTPKTKKTAFAPMLQKPKPFWSASMQPSGFSLVYSF